MKRTVIVSALAMVALFSTACGKEESKKIYSTSEGKMEVTQKEEGKVHEMTVKTEEGTATMKTGAGAVPEDLGVPIYPGVEKEEGGTWSMSGSGDKGKGAFSSTILFSKDPIDKVAAFYKEKLKGENPQTFEMAMPNGKMVNMQIEKEGTVTHLVLSENKEKGGTNIRITKAEQ